MILCDLEDDLVRQGCLQAYHTVSRYLQNSNNKKTLKNYSIDRQAVRQRNLDLDNNDVLLFRYTAGLNLFAKHAGQFKEYIAKDHEVSQVSSCGCH